MESSVCSGPLHLLFCSSTLQMPQQVTILVLPPYILGRVIDNFYPLKLHYHPSTCNERFRIGNARAMLFLTRQTWHPVPSLPTDTSNVVCENFRWTLTICLSYPELVDVLHETSYGWHLRPGKIENWILTSSQIGRPSIPCHASYYFNTPIPSLRICLEILTEICNIFPCHRHDKAYLKTPFMGCHSEKQIEGRDTRPCHTGDFNGPSR